MFHIHTQANAFRMKEIAIRIHEGIDGQSTRHFRQAALNILPIKQPNTLKKASISSIVLSCYAIKFTTLLLIHCQISFNYESLQGRMYECILSLLKANKLLKL